MIRHQSPAAATAGRVPCANGASQFRDTVGEGGWIFSRLALAHCMLQPPLVFLRAALVLALLTSNVASANAADQRARLRATRVARPPAVDGVVGLEEWQGVPVTDAFT